MWDRRFLFSDDRIIARLRDEFVPAVGNTHEIQNGRSGVRNWFMAAAAKVKPDIERGITSQGFYVMGADGSAYAFNNNRSVERVLGMMDKGAAGFRAQPPGPVVFSEEAMAEPYFRTPAPGTSVLRIFARIRPPVAGSDPSNENVARDHIWIPKDEIESLTKEGSLPAKTAARFCRFALVDNIRGEPDHWQPGEVKIADFSAKRIGGTKERARYALAGRYSMETPGGARGLEGSLDGEFEVDLATSRIVRFRAYGEAKAWGRSTYTPNPPPGKFPMVFAIVEADDEMAKVVAPQAIFYGNEYFEAKR